MFCRQAIGKFKAKIPKKLLSKNMALFLERRTLVSHGAPDFLPSMIRSTVDIFLQLTGNATQELRLEWIKTTAAVIVKHCPDVVNLAIAPTSTKLKFFAEDTSQQIAFAIAVLVCDEDMARKCLSLQTSPITQTNFFGQTLCNAVRGNSVPVLQLVLASNSFESKTIVKALREAYLYASWDTAKALMTWHHQQGHRLPVPTIRYLIEKAAAGDALEFLEEMLGLGYVLKGKEQYCHSRDSERSWLHCQNYLRGILRSPAPQRVLKFCKDHLILDGWTKYAYDTHRSPKVRRVLEHAVHNHTKPLVEAIFALRMYSTTGKALRLAIKMNETDMVRLLLDKGADPEGELHGYSWSAERSSTCELARPNSEVYKMLQTAIKEKMARLRAFYRMPYRTVWDSKKQEDVRVQYTFHASELGDI
jgi:hypothetical protein